MARRDSLYPPRSLFERFPPGARRARRSQPDFGAAGLWRFAGLGGARASPERKASDVSARWKCGWRRPPPKCARRRNCVIAFSIKRVRPSPIRAGCSRAATSMPMTRSATIFLVLDHATREGRPERQSAGGGRHLSSAAAADGGGIWRLLHLGRIRYRRTDRAPRQSAIPRSSAAPACWRPTATSARSNCCGTASPAICGRTAPTSCSAAPASTAPTPSGWRCRCRSCITTRGRRKAGARARCPSAMSR